VAEAVEDIEFRLLLEAVFRKYHYDFRGYSTASLKRRLRQARERMNCSSFSQLQDRVLHDPSAFPELISFLTVQVSELFRDPAYFRAIRERVVPYLRTYPSLKVWVAGCSAGEEVYSLAILFREEGLAYGGAVFDKSLRRRAVFSDHSLAADQVFAEVQLVSCRNVLIYFDRPLQDRAIGLFKDSLSRKGFLGLGAKESLRFSSHADGFETFDQAERIYRKRGDA